MLSDHYKRPLKDLRISVTDRCNFRCTYCMPLDEYEWLEKSEVLSFEEITRVVRLFVRLGVEKVRLTGGAIGRAIAPAGASRGSHEAIDLRDGGPLLGGLGVGQAVHNLRDAIGQQLLGLDASDQASVDAALIALDGTPNKKRLGANALIAVSMAVLHAAAQATGLPPWQYVSGGNRSGCRYRRFKFLAVGRTPVAGPIFKTS